MEDTPKMEIANQISPLQKEVEIEVHQEFDQYFIHVNLETFGLHQVSQSGSVGWKWKNP